MSEGAFVFNKNVFAIKGNKERKLAECKAALFFDDGTFQISILNQNDLIALRADYIGSIRQLYCSLSDLTLPLRTMEIRSHT